MNINPKDKPVFVIDWTSLKSMMEKIGHGWAMLKKLEEMNDAGARMPIITNTSTVIGAILRLNANTKVKDIQRVLAVLDIVPDGQDYTDENDLREGILQLAILNGGEHDDKRAR